MHVGLFGAEHPGSGGGDDYSVDHDARVVTCSLSTTRCYMASKTRTIFGVAVVAWPLPGYCCCHHHSQAHCMFGTNNLNRWKKYILARAFVSQLQLRSSVMYFSSKAVPKLIRYRTATKQQQQQQQQKTDDVIELGGS